LAGLVGVKADGQAWILECDNSNKEIFFLELVCMD
jgi:hypothetical protein